LVVGGSIAHLHAGDRKKAIEALERFVPGNSPIYKLRLDWSEILKAGGDPFTPEVLAEIQRLAPLPNLAEVEEKVLKSLEAGGAQGNDRLAID
jgi:hypothetical protein